MNGKPALVIAAIAFYLAFFGGGGGILPNPSPVPVTSPKVLTIWEQNDIGELTDDQKDFISSIRTQSTFYEIVKGAGGESRTYDDDTNIDGLSEPWKSMMQVERDGLPWVVIATPDGGTSQPLPETEADQKALLEDNL